MRQQPAPEPQEIVRACARIRCGWSEAEHRFRAGLPRRPRRVVVQVVPVDSLPGIEDEEDLNRDV